ncbi:MAG: uroporphyrinogen-III C-methyltransferase [Leptospirillum sp.]
MDSIAPEKKFGTVYLVGGGPGDPELLTIKGKKALEKAQVVLYDHLSSLDLLDLVPETAEYIDVGKERGHPKLGQREIEELMIDRAQKGLTVVRLKGGDPLVFGRGGEEGQALEKAGIPYIIIPGVTSAISVPAYAGVPVSHRDTNSRISIITGHGSPDRMTDKEISSLAVPMQTLIVMMGVEHIQKLAQKLLAAGRSKETPVMIVRWGTTSAQTSWETTLDELSVRTLDPPVKPPAVVIIGESAGKNVRLSWKQHLPLTQKTVMITRERDQADSLKNILTSLGAEVIICPAIKIEPPDDWTETDNAIRELNRWNWIMFLSPNGVRGFLTRFIALHRDLREIHGQKIFSLGPQTTKALSGWGIIPDLVSEESHGQGVIESMKKSLLKGEKILLIRGDRGDRSIPEELSAAGGDVSVISCYQNRLPRLLPHAEERIKARIHDGTIDAMVFYSPSAVTNILSMFAQLAPSIRQVPACAIGPTTKKALESEHFSDITVSKDTTVEAMVQAIGESLNKKLQH